MAGGDHVLNLLLGESHLIIKAVAKRRFQAFGMVGEGNDKASEDSGMILRSNSYNDLARCVAVRWA